MATHRNGCWTQGRLAGAPPWGRSVPGRPAFAGAAVRSPTRLCQRCYCCLSDVPTDKDCRELLHAPHIVPHNNNNKRARARLALSVFFLLFSPCVARFDGRPKSPGPRRVDRFSIGVWRVLGGRMTILL